MFGGPLGAVFGSALGALGSKALGPIMQSIMNILGAVIGTGVGFG
jgi:hypothetical protein